MRINIMQSAEPSKVKVGKTRLVYRKQGVAYAAVINGQFLPWPVIEAHLIARGIGRSQAYDAFMRQERI